MIFNVHSIVIVESASVVKSFDVEIVTLGVEEIAAWKNIEAVFIIIPFLTFDLFLVEFLNLTSLAF